MTTFYPFDTGVLILHPLRITGSTLSEEDALRAESTKEAAASTSEPPAGEARTLSFAELQELITQGKTDQIPNNKQIPDALSVSALPRLTVYWY